MPSPRRDRKPPVPWDRLKQIQDENEPPRPGGPHLLGILLMAFALLLFLFALLAALDPSEHIEPVRYIFVTCVLGSVVAWVFGISLLSLPSRPPYGGNQH